MSDPIRSRLAPLLAALAVLVLAPPSRAQMTPVADNRYIDARVDNYHGISQHLSEIPPGFFASWNSYIQALAEHPDYATADAFAFQVSQFFPAGINASGNTYGSQYDPSGTYSAASVARLVFRLDTPVDYTLDVWMDEGDGTNTSGFTLRSTATLTPTHELNTTGELHTNGRLGPGEYLIDGHSIFPNTSAPSFDAGAYSYIFLVYDPLAPLVGNQPPRLLIVPCGNSTTLSVLTNPPASTLTFQWQRNGVPLTNNGHFSGATSPTLTIANTCHPDSGYYNVLVTSSTGPVTEPSGFTHLVTVNTGTVITGVDETPVAPARALSIEAAGPNPFAGGTAFRYTATKPIRATFGIYNAAGARVRSLGDGVWSGTGTVRWDGKTATGSRAPAGIYFLSVDAGSIQERRKIVLLK